MGVRKSFNIVAYHHCRLSMLIGEHSLKISFRKCLVEEILHIPSESFQNSWDSKNSYRITTCLIHLVIIY